MPDGGKGGFKVARHRLAPFGMPERRADLAHVIGDIFQPVGRGQLDHLDPQPPQQIDRCPRGIGACQNQIGMHQEDLLGPAAVDGIGPRLFHHGRGERIQREVADGNQLPRIGQQHGELIRAEVHGHHPFGRRRNRRPGHKGKGGDQERFRISRKCRHRSPDRRCRNLQSPGSLHQRDCRRAGKVRPYRKAHSRSWHPPP